MIRGVNHIGLSVVNLDRSIEFYRDLLHMELAVSPIEFAGPFYDQILNLKGARGRVALMRAGSLQLELFEFAQPAPKRKDGEYPVSDHGLSHFCIEVSDIESEYQRLVTGGVRFHCPPISPPGSPIKATYARDPDGNVFELLEVEEQNR